MSTSRRKFSKEFKAKVVLESLKERETIESLARKEIGGQTNSLFVYSVILLYFAVEK